MIPYRKDPERILILKPSSLGDIIHSLPTLAALRERFPKSFICWVVKREWAGILEGHPCLDEVLSFPFEWSSIRRMIGEIRRRRFNMVVDLQGLLRTGLLSYFSGANVRVGFKEAREFSPFFYTHRVQSNEKKIHAVDRYLLIAKELGVKTESKRFDISITPQDRARVREIVKTIGGERPIFAIHPVSRQEVKRWPLERFSELADKIHQSGLGVPVFIGAKNDVQDAALIQKRMTSNQISLTGKTTLKELAVFLQMARLLITNDSGPMHLSAAVGTPVVALFGPTDPIKIGPYGNGHMVLQHTDQCSACRAGTKGPHRCLEAISVEETVEAVNNLSRRIINGN